MREEELKTKRWEIRQDPDSVFFPTSCCFDSKSRYFSGVLTTVVSGFVTFLFLEPLFVPVGLELANVALWLLAIDSALVGMALGVLLPSIFPGLCFGVSSSLLIGSVMGVSSNYFLPAVGGGLGLIGAIVSSK